MIIERVKRPEQKIPSKVWKDIVADIVTTTGSEPNDQQQRTMKDNLRSYLDDLSTGTANGEGDAKPELQKEEVLRQLKETDTYASKVLLTKRHQLIGDQTTPVKKQKLSRKSQNPKPDPNIEDSDDEEPAEMNRKEARARTTQAIEKISESIAASIKQQEIHLAQSKEKMKMEQSKHEARLALDAIITEKKRKETLKADVELLRMQLDLNLITKNEFEAQARTLFQSK